MRIFDALLLGSMLIAMLGCAKVNYTLEDLEPFVQSFESETGHSTVKVTFNFNELNGSYSGKEVGRCVYPTNSVSFDSLFWASIGDEERTVLFWHELGHCLFQLPHDGEVFPDGCGTVMNAQMTNGKCVEKHFEEMKDLYKRKIARPYLFTRSS